MSPRTHMTFWGVRGSIAAAGPRTVKYGGNSVCVSLHHGATTIVCDAGTGIREFGVSLAGKRGITAAILLTHLHLDHIVGLPFFEPLYKAGNGFVIASPTSDGISCKKALAGIMAPPYFPVSPRDFAADVEYRTIKGGVFRIDDVMVYPFSCYHPGGAMGWKFAFPKGKTLVYVSDNEPSLRNRERMLAWMAEADVLVHDAQYSSEEYGKRRGWGHSPYTYPVEMAMAAGCRKLFLYHYDPSADDRELEARLRASRALVAKYRSRLKVELACEGRTVAL